MSIASSVVRDQLTSKNLAEILRHYDLVLLTTVIFYRKDNRVPVKVRKQ